MNGLCYIGSVQCSMQLLKIDKTFNGPKRNNMLCDTVPIATVTTTAASAPMGKKYNTIQYLYGGIIIIGNLKHMLIRLNVKCITDTEH